jgi:hypothetical protein
LLFMNSVNPHSWPLLQILMQIVVVMDVQFTVDKSTSTQFILQISDYNPKKSKTGWYNAGGRKLELHTLKSH